MSCYVGIDIAKLSFEAYLIMESKKDVKKTFENTAAGFTAFVQWADYHTKKNTLHVCMEATGRYSEGLARYLYQAAIKVSVVNPVCIKSFRGCELGRIKTDQADAKLIAGFCKMHQPKGWEPPPDHIDHLRQLLNQLRLMITYESQEKARLKESPALLHKSIESHLEHLKGQIKVLKAAVKKLIGESADLVSKVDLLKTIPGVGEMTAWIALSFLYEPKRFESAKQVGAYLGLNPRIYSSGTSVRGKARLSKVGDANLRKAFFMPAVVAKQHNPIIKAFCERLAAQGKPPMLIVGAAMRKLVQMIYGVLKSGKAFDANFYQKMILAS